MQISSPYMMYVLCVYLYRTAISTNLFIHTNTPPNLWNSKQSVRKINSRYYQLTVNKMSPYVTRSTAKQSTVLVIPPNQLFQDCKRDLRFPQQFVTETLVITCLQCYCKGHKTHHHNSKTRLISVLLLT
jgi:hypothetical protein